ncbi:unnamed protein product, partial [Ectocarpus sp. 12 AP-2014]
TGDLILHVPLLPLLRLKAQRPSADVAPGTNALPVLLAGCLHRQAARGAEIAPTTSKNGRRRRFRGGSSSSSSNKVVDFRPAGGKSRRRHGAGALEVLLGGGSSSSTGRILGVVSVFGWTALLAKDRRATGCSDCTSSRRRSR